MGFILVSDPKPSSTAFTLPVAPIVVAAPVRSPAPLATTRPPKLAAPQVSVARATAPHAAPDRNRRWSPRTAFGKPGVIGSSGSAAPINCTVGDISRQGALLELDPASGTCIPDCFVLVFYNRRTRCEVNCVVRWQRDGKVGVCFAGPVHSTVDRR
jgi:hypothetical protein